jgi:hypothetical protein
MTMYIYIYVILHNSIIFNMAHINCCIYRKIPPDDEQYAYSKHVEVSY